MSTVATITMQRSSQYAPDPARERATMSQYNNNDRGEGSSSGAYSNGYSTANTSRASQQQSAVRSPSSAGHAMPGASEATTGKGDQEAPRPLRRPSGIALPTHQALVHDPVYMAARTSPIGPPPRAALPALPPGPPGNRGPPPRNGLPAPPAQQQPHQQQQGDTSGMLAMASESRPLTAVYNGDWSHPPSSMAGQSTSATHGTSSEGPSQVGSTSTSSPTKDRTNRRSTSASRQRRQQTSVDSPTNTSRAAGPSRHARHGTDASTSSSPAGPSSSGAAPQADGSTDRMASKTVLTIALLEAQTAVDLDESDQAEAAIASYSKSVELLQEVMRRVAENAGTYRQKELDRIAEIKNERMTRWKQWRLEQYRRAGLQVNPEEIHATDEEIETREERREREKREARIAKRERMRVEECAKLRVIVSDSASIYCIS